MNTLLPILCALLAVAALVRPGLVAARVFQIEEYEGQRLWRWADAGPWNWHRAAVASGAVALVAGGYAILRNQAGAVVIEAVLGYAALIALWRWQPAKKALVWTARMRRLAVITVAVGVVVALLAAVYAMHSTVAVAAVIVWIPTFMSTTLVVVLLIVANVIAKPVEAWVRRGYLRKADEHLGATAPRVIAVVGSWGKTSTKHALAQLLPDEAAALPTRQSFNTLMGITRVINEDLDAAHKTFIVEMDAYGPGEIARMCKLVQPSIAVITAVGTQHLERFGSSERIAQAIFEVVEALPADGTAVIYVGDEPGIKLAQRARDTGRTVVGYGFADDPGDVTAQGLRLDADGTHFMWRWPAHGLAVEVTTSLLGRHQALNISAALAVVALLGYDVAEAALRASQLKAVEHRLQLIAGANDVLVIDDSYNANPTGVHNALEVLATLARKQKILVTPGMVELGSLEAEENQRYGEHAAAVCDHVIVVGSARPTEAFVAGLKKANIADASLHRVDTLDAATAVIGSVAGSGDVVLFANDLPDTYL